MACSNTFGLVTGAFLLGFGLSEIPKSIWRNADWVTRQKVLSHKVAKMAMNLDSAHQELSNAIVIAQSTSKQMSKRDPLKPYMDVIDDMLLQMFREDPAFKPTGGRLGQNDMDYDADEKSIATLRRQLRIAREKYYSYRSEYTTYVAEALELEETIKNYEHGSSSGWKFVSSLRSARTGPTAPYLDTLEWIWRCILRKQFKKVLAVMLGCMSVAILLAEATLVPNGVDLSLFSILIKAAGKREMLVQIAAFLPLVYMCVCTYYSLFKVGMLMLGSLTPRQTSSVILLMICSMVARYAAPISYNFLNLIRLGGNAKTTFEKLMGNIDDAVPFFGEGFNKIYPLIMVIYTLLVASNFFDRIISVFGNWRKRIFRDDAEDMDGFDPSGVIILQKERLWLAQGSNLGEHIFPLARNFNGMSADVEAGIVAVNSTRDEIKSMTGNLSMDEYKGSHSKALKDDKTSRHTSSKESIGSKYAAYRDQQRKQFKASASVSLLDVSDSRDDHNSREATQSSSRLANTWASMKRNFANVGANLGVKKFLVPQQTHEAESNPGGFPSESLDEIFGRFKSRTEGGTS